MADPRNFIVRADSLGLIVECTHTECRRNGSGHYTRTGPRMTVAEAIEVMDTHDRLEGNHDGDTELDRLRAEIAQARSLRIMPRSVEALIDTAVHTPARVRSWLKARGWEVCEQYTHISEWRHEGLAGAVVMVVDRPASDYARRMKELVVDLAGLHGLGELGVLAGIEASDA